MTSVLYRLAGSPGRRIVIASLLLMVAFSASASQAAESPLFKLLKSGRLPASRQANVVEYLCKNGSATELGYIFQQCTAEEGYRGPLRLVALEGMAEAAEVRKVTPEADLTSLGKLIAPGAEVEPGARLAAVRLAGLWKVEALQAELQAVALADESDPTLRRQAVSALVALGAEASRPAIAELTASDRPVADRMLGVAALARVDLQDAAVRAAALLKTADADDNPAPLVDAFLEVKDGSQALARALAADPPPADVAKVSLRHLYSIGRTDQPLVEALGAAAGLGQEAAPLSPEQLKALAADVQSRGSAERGEAIFRRVELSCSKCHAINGAGGQAGPDLIGLGGSSPVDYVVESILLPEKAVKEEYQMATVLTDRGEVLQGIIKEETPDRLVLRDATGREHVVAGDEIEEMKKGGSLMPKGLANFLTRSELVDLVRFLSELGLPGGRYERSTEPIFRRWRVLKPEAAANIPEPTGGELPPEVQAADGSQWNPVYTLVSGVLPLDEVAASSAAEILYLRTEVEVSSAGPIGLQLNSAEGLSVWVNDQPLQGEKSLACELPAGRHTITLRIDRSQRKDNRLSLRLLRPDGSAAEAIPVGGA